MAIDEGSSVDEKQENSDLQNKQIEVSGKKTRTDPDNKYYEVEAILDGPRKRREHLLKLCYKVRWKGYGPEADTWQPIADLTNVQDMIDDFNREKIVKKGKKKQIKSSKSLGRPQRVRNQSWVDAPSDKEGVGDNGKQFDPVYGTVKDKFWKDLELGRHQNHTELFSADMYSKVKGSRRAANGELSEVSHKKHHRQSRSLHAPSQHNLATSKSPSRLLRGDYLRKPRSSSPVSSKYINSSSRSESPELHSFSSRVRKRSSDSFSTTGYMDTKRSCRLRKLRNGHKSTEDKESSISSVTSETVGIVRASIVITPYSVPDDSRASLIPTPKTNSTHLPLPNPVYPGSSPSAGECSDSDDSTEDVSNVEQSGRMTVSSETMLTVTTETIRLDLDAGSFNERAWDDDSPMPHSVKSKDICRHHADECCQDHSSGINVGASGDGSETLQESFDDGGATSGGALPGRCKTNKRSALDVQSEASGAVERSHNEDCLWNGACNRSDCKSNRRRNMKNGQRKLGGVMPIETDDDDQNDGGENTETDNENNGDEVSNVGDHSQVRTEENHELGSEGVASEHVDAECDHNVGSRNSASEGKKSLFRFVDGSSEGTSRSGLLTSASFQPSSPSKEGSSSTTGQAISSRNRRPVGHASTTHTSIGKGSGSQSHLSAESRRLLFTSSHTDSSDSSFDEGPTSGLSLTREALRDSFGRVDTLAHHLHMDTIAGSTTGRTPGLSSSTVQTPSAWATSRSTSGVRKSNMELERPGLFSENYGAFLFTRQDSENDDSDTVADKRQQGMFPSLSSSMNISSGEQHFGSSKTSSLAVSSSLQAPIATDVSNSHSRKQASSQVQASSSEPRKYAEKSEAHTTKKRSTKIIQPVENIPSPNTREFDLDQRIMTSTCDELEDFVEQGEERHKQKDIIFVSNADLFQAVNLSKAEVVKRAIKQFKSSDHKLDFEQPDNMGVTLLMRAVQKGTVIIAEMLLEHGVNVNAQQTNGTTALMIAAEQNGTCLVALLLKYGANSSMYTAHSDLAETALMKAIKKQNRDVVNLMLRVGVNIAAPTCTSVSALELAVDRRNPHIEGLVRFHCQRLDQAFRSRVISTLEGTANLLEPLFAMQCLPLRESSQFVVKFNSNIHPVAPGEGFLLFIAHTKITEKGVKCRFHGGCPISSVTLNGVAQSPLTKDVNFVTSCHPIIQGCNTLVIHKLADYTSKAKLLVQAFRAKLLPC